MTGTRICLTCGQPFSYRVRPDRPIEKQHAKFCGNSCRQLSTRKKRLDRPEVKSFSGNSRSIYTNNGTEITVDAEYYDWLDSYSWYISENGYAVAGTLISETKNVIRMHRLISDTPDDLITDHINRNRLDNRSSNLRNVNFKQNSMNSSQRINARNYCWDKGHNRWLVYSGHVTHGTYKTETEAMHKAAEIRSGFTHR